MPPQSKSCEALMGFDTLKQNVLPFGQGSFQATACAPGASKTQSIHRQSSGKLAVEVRTHRTLLIGLRCCRKEVDVNRLEECQTCEGDGIKAGTSASTCSTCGGSGQLVQPVRTPLGNFQQVIQCPDCDGSGERSTPCGTCGGDGRVRRSKRLEVTIPAGKDS